MNESDFTIVINKDKEIFGPKTENEVFTDKFIKMLDSYGLNVNSKDISKLVETVKTNKP